MEEGNRRKEGEVELDGWCSNRLGIIDKTKRGRKGKNRDIDCTRKRLGWGSRLCGDVVKVENVRLDEVSGALGQGLSKAKGVGVVTGRLGQYGGDEGLAGGMGGWQGVWEVDR